VIRRVQIHDMLLAGDICAPAGTHVLRLHYRSVMANDRRAPYDYFLMVCGPVAFSDWTISTARVPGLPSPPPTARAAIRRGPRPVAAQSSV